QGCRPRHGVHSLPHDMATRTGRDRHKRSGNVGAGKLRRVGETLRLIHSLTTVPIGSPQMARLMLPGWKRLKTMIGILLSMHSEHFDGGEYAAWDTGLLE